MLASTLREQSTDNIQRVLVEFLGSTAVGDSQWIHHAETGLSLDEFQAVRALAENWQLAGRIEVLETHHETETRRRLTDAIRFRRLT